MAQKLVFKADIGKLGEGCTEFAIHGELLCLSETQWQLRVVIGGISSRNYKFKAPVLSRTIDTKQASARQAKALAGQQLVELAAKFLEIPVDKLYISDTTTWIDDSD